MRLPGEQRLGDHGHERSGSSRRGGPRLLGPPADRLGAFSLGGAGRHRGGPRRPLYPFTNDSSAPEERHLAQRQPRRGGLGSIRRREAPEGRGNRARAQRDTPSGRSRRDMQHMAHPESESEDNLDDDDEYDE